MQATTVFAVVGQRGRGGRAEQVRRQWHCHSGSRFKDGAFS
jgi:hypothetical protein